MLRTLLLAITVVALAALAACGGNDSPAADPTAEPQSLEGVRPIPLNSQLAVGDDRFAVGLQNSANELILGADLSISFYTLQDNEGTLAGEAPATFVSFVEEDGSVETGGYVAYFDFGQAGRWGVEIEGTVDGQRLDTPQYQFDVVEDSPAPAIGEPAPPSEQATLEDVDDISEIDSSDPPNPDLHALTVAAALELGKPSVIAFATPAFCTSRICGPVMEQVVLPVWKKYGDAVTVVHIEPYDLEKARSGDGLVAVPAMDGWGLQSEPWIFVVDGQGNVAARFEGISSVEEVERAVDQVLAGG